MKVAGDTIVLVRDFNMPHRWKRPPDGEIRSEIHQKHKSWKRYLRNRTPQEYANYRNHRNRVKTLIRSRDRLEKNEIALSCKTNPKKILEPHKQ